jgi:signal transduction histidine kinase
VQTQKFSALNKLAAGIAHEFNNVVAGILGSAELVAMDLPEGHPGHESLKHVFEASNRARDFVQKIRALAQRPAIERQPILLQPVIEDCLQILRNIIPVRAEIRARINPACPRVNADPAGIHQVVLDLCLHAWQNLPEGRGQIQIELDPSAAAGPGNELSARFANAGHVCLTVRDNSQGLDKNQREKIFDPFNTRKSTGKKIGLELFLVREIIQAHQGEIFVTGEPGQGLAFQIYLPVARPA